MKGEGNLSGIFRISAGGRYAHGSLALRPRSSYASQTDFVAEAVSNQFYLLYIFRSCFLKERRRARVQ